MGKSINQIGENKYQSPHFTQQIHGVKKGQVLLKVIIIMAPLDLTRGLCYAI